MKNLECARTEHCIKDAPSPPDSKTGWRMVGVLHGEGKPSFTKDNDGDSKYVGQIKTVLVYWQRTGYDLLDCEE